MAGNQESIEKGITRREVLRRGTLLGIAATLHPKLSRAQPVTEEVDGITVDSSDTIDVEPTFEPLSHEQFLNKVQNSPEYSDLLNTQIKTVLNRAINTCVKENGEWVIPSENYKDYYFSRDSYWLHAAKKDKRLLDIAAKRFHDDQKLNKDGHIATALRRDGTRPENRDRDEESTMMDILREYERKRAGGTPDKTSLNASYKFILSHIKDGRYVTVGETRTGPNFDGDNQVGSYHYWVDTYRPAGKPVATPEVFAYNQGLLPVVLRALKEMGVTVDQKILDQAEAVYANMTNPMDDRSLPQRENSTVVDVSSLVGEALSLYYFNRPLLSDQRVAATIEQFDKVLYPDGKFLGFRVISDYNGGLRPTSEYAGSTDNREGDYQRGGSWMLYDLLALYVGVRHGIPGYEKLFIQRLQSEVRYVPSSHEFIRTSEADLGGSDKQRDDYGWNAFALNLLP